MSLGNGERRGGVDVKRGDNKDGGKEERRKEKEKKDEKKRREKMKSGVQQTMYRAILIGEVWRKL